MKNCKKYDDCFDAYNKNKIKKKKKKNQIKSQIIQIDFGKLCSVLSIYSCSVKFYRSSVDLLILSFLDKTFKFGLGVGDILAEWPGL